MTTLSLFTSLALAGFSFANADPAPCLHAMAKIWAPETASSYAGGSLPRIVKYDPPHTDLTVWKRRDGTLLVLDGKGLQAVPSFEGRPNGHTFVLNPDASGKRMLAPSVYRKVALADGRTFELHRVGESGRERTILRGEAEDNAAIEEESADPEKTLAIHAARFAESLNRLEQSCEQAQTRFVDQSFSEQLGALAERFLMPRPGAAAAAPSDRLDSVRAEENIIAEEIEAMREARQKVAGVKALQKDYASMAAEREKPANRLGTEALRLDPAASKALLTEATEDFAQRLDLKHLNAEDRASLAACEGFLELPAVEAPASHPLPAVPGVRGIPGLTAPALAPPTAPGK